MKKASILKIFFLISSCCILVSCSLTSEEVAKRNDYLERAQSYYRGKKYINALQQIELALEVDPNTKRGIISKGWTLFYLNQNDEAEKWFVRGYEMDNADVWTHQGLAAVYFRRAINIGKRLDRTLLEISSIERSEQLEKEKQINATINKQRQEAELWFDKSLIHYKEAIEYSDGGQDLFNMLASVHSMIALPYYGDAIRATNQKFGETKDENYVTIFSEKGLPHYDKALGYLEKYVKFTEEELQPIDTYLEQKKFERERIGLLEEEHTKLDRQVQFLKIQREINRKRNRIAQNFAADIDFKIAVLMGKAKKQAKTRAEAEKYDIFFKKHLTTAKNRIFDMVKDYPEMKSAAKNLATIARLEGDYETAIKYLQEFITNNPMIRPIDKVQVREELEVLKANKGN